MKWAVAVFAILAAYAGSASAAGYDDFTSGMTANLRGESEQAVTAFTAALAASDLVGAYKPTALRGRASAYLRLDKCQEALADLNAFAALKPDDRSILSHRVWAGLCLKDVAAARKDLDAATKGGATAADLWEFARLEWRYDMFDEAMKTGQEAFKAINKKGESAPYILLWEAVAALRAGKLDAAAIPAGLSEIKLDDWPEPIFDLYLGKQTPQGVLKEAGSWSQSLEDARICEANFYTGEWQLSRGDKDAAAGLFLAVAKNCPIDFIERSAAASELKRLGVPVPKE